MKKNINDGERALRLTTGAVLASMAFWGPKKKWMLAFLMPAITGVVGTCPLYSALGVSTCNEDSITEKQANDYFPMKSDSEIIAGHPIVGSA